MSNIKLRDAKRILKNNGYTLSYVNGSHYHFVKMGCPRIVLPFHVNRNNECNRMIWQRICKENNIRL